MIVRTPTLIIDKGKCIANIKAMALKAMKSNVFFRPHFKTHQSAEIGEWFKDGSVRAITVSSVSMAEYFSDNGWNDITVAFTTNINEIDGINKLAKKIKINLLVDNTETLKCISDKLLHKAGVFIEIDTGYHRTGIWSENLSLIDDLVEFIKITPKLQFRGFLTHSGNTYTASSKDEIKNIFNDSRKKLISLKQRYISDFSDMIISVGDTPSCSIMDDFEGIDEIRPGNFVFYDVMQYFLGSCKTEQVAVSVACPVVSKNEDRSELVIYGGAVHLSKDFVINKENKRTFGLVAERKDNGWGGIIPGTRIISLSQEHGIVKTNDKFFKSIGIGEILCVLPVHSCLSANNFKNYLLTSGEIISKK